MSSRKRAFVLLLLAMSPALGGCGGGGGGGSATSSRPTIRCEGPRLTTAPQLPPAFPKPPGVTYVTAKRQGPTLIVTGYFEGSLEDAYDRYRDGFEATGYDILFDEIEAQDSEVSYRDPDGETSGLVALRAECTSGNISVRITNRPA